MSFPLQEVLQLDREIVEKNHPPDQSESEGQMDLQAAYLIDHIYIYIYGSNVQYSEAPLV